MAVNYFIYLSNIVRRGRHEDKRTAIPYAWRYWLMDAKAPENAVIIRVVMISWYFVYPTGFIRMPAATSPTMTPVPVEICVWDAVRRVGVVWGVIGEGHSLRASQF